MTAHWKKMIAPIVVTAIAVLYYALYFGLLFQVLSGLWLWVFGLVPLALAGVMIGVCVERIQEIRKGEEDDLSQY